MPLSLSPDTRLGPVTLVVADLERSLGFYRGLAGLRELRRDSSGATLGAADAPVLHLVEDKSAKPAPPHASGLYHTAIVYPDRASLARVIRHIVSAQYPFTGASDHLVSEAFYLDDPDGLGVELYRDRPRDKWRWSDGKLVMSTLPLNVPELLDAADGPFDGAPPDTRVGHVHLKVSDIPDAERFYRDDLGLDVMARYGDGATFLAAGGYHHHIAANTWQSRSGSPAGEGSVGLREIVVVSPGATTQALTDPWGHRVVVRGTAA